MLSCFSQALIYESLAFLPPLAEHELRPPLPFAPTTLVVAHRFPAVEELSRSIMCVLISWHEMGQISSTSKGEISCLVVSSFTSEAKTFSAKERVASSISARRKRRLQGQVGS